MMSKNPKIALIHDELIRRGGAEIVFETLAGMYPQADLYALYAGNKPYVTINGVKRSINTSFLQKFPVWFRRHPSRLLPLLPHAVEQFDVSDYDVVISSASGFAKGIISRSTIPHISYIHTPTRYLWDSAHDVVQRHGAIKGWSMRILQHYLRMADFTSAQRADVLLANSKYTQQRIHAYYRRESTVVYPPIDTSFFTPRLTEKLNISQAPFLVVGRLSPAKNFDHAITVCEKLNLPLVVIGVGQDYARLKRLAGRHTTFVGKVSREELRRYYRSARALIQPGIEDFGMATAESISCGTPVIAFGEGGVREIVTHGKQGLLYSEARPESLAESIRQFLLWEKSYIPESLQQKALHFSTYHFEQAIRSQVETVLKTRDIERNEP